MVDKRNWHVDLITGKVHMGSETRTLPCRLSQEELLDRGHELAKVSQDVDAEEDRQTQVKAELKATMAELEARRAKLSSTVYRQEEYREVKCDTIGDTRRGVVDVVRHDTGEVVTSRAMTDEERQGALEF